MKQILIALDYDPTARKVAESGFEMAKAMGAHVTLLHVLVAPEMYAGVYGDMGVWQINAIDQVEAFKNIETASQSFLERAKKHLGSKSIDILLKEGDTAQMILQIAAETKAECIVMGSHSSKWLESILLGSVTAEVLRKTDIPMYIVPTKKMD